MQLSLLQLVSKVIFCFQMSLALFFFLCEKETECGKKERNGFVFCRENTVLVCLSSCYVKHLLVSHAYLILEFFSSPEFCVLWKTEIAFCIRIKVWPVVFSGNICPTWDHQKSPYQLSAKESHKEHSGVRGGLSPGRRTWFGSFLLFLLRARC